jgi:putative ABC transport system substrate-binding protein
MRRLGILTQNAEDDPLYKSRVVSLTEALAALGWKAGDNLRLDWRFCGGDKTLLPRYADELVALAPDALLAVGTPSVAALRARTRTIPIVFTLVSDPVSQGFVESLSRPGGNVTGFTDFDLSMAGKWVELLAGITPSVTDIGILYNPTAAPFAASMLKIVGEAASAHGATDRAAPVNDEADIDRAATAIAREAGAGMLVLPDTFTMVNRARIVHMAARLHLPAVYWHRNFFVEGGLMSYGVVSNDSHRWPAAYIDRIFKGADPGELPVQNPTKFELLINLKTARALGVEFPPTLLAAADEVIE